MSRRNHGNRPHRSGPSGRAVDPARTRLEAPPAGPGHDAERAARFAPPPVPADPSATAAAASVPEPPAAPAEAAASVDAPSHAPEPAASTRGHAGATPVNGHAMTSSTGQPLNGAPLNGAPLNGGPVNGGPMNGAPLNGGPMNGASMHGGPAMHGPGSSCTAPQLRRFIKSRPYVPMHELRRRFGIAGDEDDMSAIDVAGRRLFVGLPSREGTLVGELLRGGDIGYELSLDPRTPVVIGLYPMRPVARG